MKNKIFYLGLVLILAITGCSNSNEKELIEDVEVSGSSSIGLIDDERILSAESEPGNWLAFGRTYDERRFSPLKQINKESISDLGLVWSKDMGTNLSLIHI